MVPWRWQPKTRVVTVERLERWEGRGITRWARVIPKNECVIDVDGEVGESQESLPRTFRIESSREPHLWFTCAQRPSYRCGVNIRGWKCDILPAGRLEFIVGPGKRVEDWNIPLAELPDDLLPVGPRGGSPGCPHSTQQDGRWVFPLYVEDPGGYARKIIGNELAKLRHTRVGSRNHTLNAAAFKFAKLGEFVTVEHWRALVDTANGIGLDPEEVHETIRSAIAVQRRHC